MTRDMTDRERRDIAECTELVREIRDVAVTDAGAQAVGAALDAMASFLERGEVFEADGPPGDTTTPTTKGRR